MLERLQTCLSKGPLETTIGIHGVNVMLSKKVLIVDADQTGISVRMSKTFGGYSETVRLQPWPSVMFIDLP